MKVIASSGNAYLIEVGEGVGRVLDVEQRRFFPPNAIHAILARGYWEPFRGDEAPILAALGDADDPLRANEATAVEEDAARRE